MRKIIPVLVILLAAGAGVLRAAGSNVNEKVLQSFHKKFSTAKEVNWNTLKQKGLYEARFVFNNEHIEAFYNEEGELLSTARLIREDLLPILVAGKLNRDYGNYAVNQIVELSSDETISYLVTVYNAKEVLLLKMYCDGGAQRIRRTKNN